jgi:hypothetical protein
VKVQHRAGSRRGDANGPLSAVRATEERGSQALAGPGARAMRDPVRPTAANTTK